MTIIIRKVVKYKWCKITLLLCDVNIACTMSWTSIFTGQMTMISYFISYNFLITKSTNVIILIIFLIYHNDIFISIFKVESHFIF